MKTNSSFITAKVCTVALVLCAVASSIRATEYYVSNTGTDTNPGTISAPFYSIQTAADRAQAGDTIYVRGGTFPYVNTIRLQGHPGTAAAPIKLWAYPGEHPVLDFSSQPVGSSNRGIYLTNDYWYIKGLDVGHAGDNGLKLEGSHNIIEQCVFHDNQDAGLQIGFGHPYVNNGNQAAYNTIINCDSYHNYDTATHGGNADGFSCKMHPGYGNVFTGCRSWFNSDDGWDLFETDHTVIISNCWAWHNGDKSLFPSSSSFGGNGNGIKLGGNGSGGSSKGTHYAIQCISFNNNYGNSKNNFSDNSHADGEILYNCVAWGANYNFFFEQSVNSGKSNLFANSVSFNGGSSGNPVHGVSFGSGTVIQENNTWTLGLNASAADFTDITEATAAAPRQPDGSLPTGFGRLVASSILIDKGVNVGLPYSGSAPDLGAYEFSSSPTPPSAPTGLTATPGNAQVSLIWNASSGATSYNVKRATVSGGPYTTIASGVTSTSYVNTGLSNGTTYYFVVSAVNAAGESANSGQVSATPSATQQAPPAPTGLTATPGNAQVSLIWTASSGATSYNVKRATVNGGPYTTIASGVTATSYVNTGLSNGTTYYFVVSAVNAAGESANSTQVSATPTAPGGTTVTFTSIATEDGRILESSENSNTGGSVNSSDATSSALRTGDDNSNRQFKTILSFDTSSLPDGATIVSATLRMRRGSLTGTNPFTTFGSCYVDIKGGSGFNNSTTLQTADFQAAADATQVATMSDPGTDGALSSGVLNATGRSLINKTGKTQFRVYFALDDNDNSANDYIGWYSGNDATASNRPTLEITYQ